MARVFLLLLGLVAAASACTSSSGRTPAWDIGPNTEIYPIYDDGAVGIGITHRFRRAADVPTKDGFFFLLDLNEDDFITRAEWLREGGSEQDYDKLLLDLDKDGDGKISREEFESVKDVYFKTRN